MNLFNSGFSKSTNLKNSHQVNSQNQCERKTRTGIHNSPRVFVTTTCAQNLPRNLNFALAVETRTRGIPAFLSERNSREFYQRIVANIFTEAVTLTEQELSKRMQTELVMNS